MLKILKRSVNPRKKKELVDHLVTHSIIHNSSDNS